MAHEVRIKLTSEQKAKIKAGTGKVMSEIRVGSLGNNPAVSASKAISARAPRSVEAASTRAPRSVEATSTRAPRSVEAASTRAPRTVSTRAPRSSGTD